MLQPKRTKFRREQKNRMKGNSGRGNQLAFGSFGLKNLENCWLTAHQIEAARQAISRRMNREGQIWIRVFPVKPFTAKPLDTRMGKGKGDPQGFVAPIPRALSPRSLRAASCSRPRAFPSRPRARPCAWLPTSSRSPRSSSCAGTMSKNKIKEPEK